MKRALYNASVLLPILFIHYILLEKPLAIYIPEIQLCIGYGAAGIYAVFLTILWLCCSPFKKSCCNGTITEVLFNLVPIEIILAMIFAQRHFWILLFIIGFFLAVDAYILMVMEDFGETKRKLKKRRRRIRFLLGRCSVLASFVFFLIPCFIVLFFYGTESPTYTVRQELQEEMFSDIADPAEEADLYELYEPLWPCLKEADWAGKSIDEQMCILQELADLEALALKVPRVPVIAQVMETDVIGAYSLDEQRIRINTQWLGTFPVEDIIDCICHEVYHSCQHYIVRNMDWTNPAADTSYFDDLRTWQQEQENYKDADEYGYEAYKEQAVEVSARSYAEMETEKILSYVRG